MDRQIGLAMLARLHRFGDAEREALTDLAAVFFPHFGTTARLDGYNRHLNWCHEDRRVNRFASLREDRKGLRRFAAGQPKPGCGIIATPSPGTERG